MWLSRHRPRMNPKAWTVSYRWAQCNEAHTQLHQILVAADHHCRAWHAYERFPKSLDSGQRLRPREKAITYQFWSSVGPISHPAIPRIPQLESTPQTMRPHLRGKHPFPYHSDIPASLRGTDRSTLPISRHSAHERLKITGSSPDCRADDPMRPNSRRDRNLEQLGSLGQKTS